MYHCISRIQHRRFLLDVREKEVMRRVMRQVSAFCGVEVLTYCFMTNHFHLLVKVKGEKGRAELTDAELILRVRRLYGKGSAMANHVEKVLRREDSDWMRERLKARMEDVSAFMKEFKQRFSIWYNAAYGKHGTLWSERFKSVLVQKDEFVVKLMAAYIDLNPVRAGIVADPKDYRWSGYGEAIGGGRSARMGIQAIFEVGRWHLARRVYEGLLYPNSARLSKASSNQKAEDVTEALERGGKLSIQEVLRYRVRYLIDGAIIGSKEFIEGWHKAHERKKPEDDGKEGRLSAEGAGGKKLKGDVWGEVRVLRRLRGRIFG